MNTDFKHLDLFTPEGFRKLYDACYESLAVYAVRMTANSEAAEDIVRNGAAHAAQAFNGKAWIIIQQREDSGSSAARPPFFIR